MHLQRCVSNRDTFPIILIVTTGSICASLDYEITCVVLRVGFSSSMMDAIQEMGGHNIGKEQQVENADYFKTCVSLYG